MKMTQKWSDLSQTIANGRKRTQASRVLIQYSIHCTTLLIVLYYTLYYFILVWKIVLLAFGSVCPYFFCNCQVRIYLFWIPTDPVISWSHIFGFNFRYYSFCPECKLITTDVNNLELLLLLQNLMKESNNQGNQRVKCTQNTNIKLYWKKKSNFVLLLDAQKYCKYKSKLSGCLLIGCSSISVNCDVYGFVKVKKVGLESEHYSRYVRAVGRLS